MNNESSHEDFITTINEERNYRELKESIRMMKGQEDNVKCIKCKKMPPYCLKCNEILKKLIQ